MDAEMRGLGKGEQDPLRGRQRTLRGEQGQPVELVKLSWHHLLRGLPGTGILQLGSLWSQVPWPRRIWVQQAWLHHSLDPCISQADSPTITCEDWSK